MKREKQEGTRVVRCHEEEDRCIRRATIRVVFTTDPKEDSRSLVKLYGTESDRDAYATVTV